MGYIKAYARSCGALCNSLFLGENVGLKGNARGIDLKVASPINGLDN